MVKEYIAALVDKAKIAQSKIEDFSQEQIDAMVKAMGKAVYDRAEELSAAAAKETGLGHADMKTIKHRSITMAQWNYLKDKKSVGVLEVDDEKQLITLAKPMGVVGAIAPMTNPTTTAVHNAMIAVKSGNSVIVGPHPKAKSCTQLCIKIMTDAIIGAGGPENLVQYIDEPSIEASGELMRQADVIVATGGFGLVKSAYSSGRPAFGVGQGNVQTIIDTSVADIDVATAAIIGNKAYDMGIPCTGDQTIHIPRELEKEVLESFARQGAYVIRDEKEVEIMRQNAFVDGAQNLKIVGQPAISIAKTLGLPDAPESTRILLFEIKKQGKDEVLSKEILAPIGRFVLYDDFKDTVEKARTTLLMEGAGHTSTIWTTNEENIVHAGNRIPVGRLLVNQGGSGASGGSYFNGLNPTISIGCGTWGNNSISENLTYKHLMNVTKVSKIIPNVVPPTPEEVWG